MLRRNSRALGFGIGKACRDSEGCNTPHPTLPLKGGGKKSKKESGAARQFLAAKPGYFARAYAAMASIRSDNTDLIVSKSADFSTVFSSM